MKIKKIQTFIAEDDETKAHNVITFGPIQSGRTVPLK